MSNRMPVLCLAPQPLTPFDDIDGACMVDQSFRQARCNAKIATSDSDEVVANGMET